MPLHSVRCPLRSDRLAKSARAKSRQRCRWPSLAPDWFRSRRRSPLSKTTEGVLDRCPLRAERLAKAARAKSRQRGRWPSLAPDWLRSRRSSRLSKTTEGVLHGPRTALVRRREPAPPLLSSRSDVQELAREPRRIRSEGRPRTGCHLKVLTVLSAASRSVVRD